MLALCRPSASLVLSCAMTARGEAVEGDIFRFMLRPSKQVFARRNL